VRVLVVLAIYMAILVGGFVGMISAYPAAQSEVAQNIFLWAPWFPVIVLAVPATLPLSMRWANE